MAVATSNGRLKVETVPEIQTYGIDLEPLEVAELLVPIRGTAPLIVHAFGEKARKEMGDKQGTTEITVKRKKAPKDPVALYEAARYRLSDGRDGFPAAGFKSAIVNSARFFAQAKMVDLKIAILVLADEKGLVAIDGTPAMREDTVRIGAMTKTTDLRYRPEFVDWGAMLRIQYLPQIVTARGVVNLVNAAGLGGIGEWRPSAPMSKNGSFGTFRVVTEGDR